MIEAALIFLNRKDSGIIVLRHALSSEARSIKLQSLTCFLPEDDPDAALEPLVSDEGLSVHLPTVPGCPFLRAWGFVETCSFRIAKCLQDRFGHNPET